MKMNNKGFAISTVVYGLSIMGILIVSILMSTMSNTRTNNKSVAKSVEEELNRYSKTSTSFDSSVENGQTFTVPTGETGWYRIELWGASGGSSGGNGAYTSGVIKLKEGTSLYFFVGQKGDSSNTGGMETDVRVIDGDYTTEISYNSRIMVAAGGGISEGADGGTLVGYTSKMKSSGGYIDYKGVYDSTFDLLSLTAAENNTNGTLVGYPADYEESNIKMSNNTVGIKGSSGGGDGYVPSDNAATGGVSYISGYAGVRSTIKGVRKDVVKYTNYETGEYNASTGEYEYDSNGTNYYFLDGMMLPGVNSGNGKAKIEKVASIELENFDNATLPRKNTKMDNVKYVRDCITGEANNVDIQVIANGEKKDDGTLSAQTTVNGSNCRTYTLTATTKVDEIAVFHGTSGHDYKNHTIEVSSDGTTWQYLKGKGTSTELSETETVTGIRISAYQYDSTETFPIAGNYYLIPVLIENKVVTASETATTDVNAISIEYLNGYKRQKWTVEEIPVATRNSSYDTNTKEYKVVELARYKSLTITLDENRQGNEIYTGEVFNKYARNEPQIWKLVPVGNGTYVIKTVVSYFDSGKPTGFLVPQIRSKYDNATLDSYQKIIVGKTNYTTQRFKLVSIDYSSTADYTSAS